MSEMPILFIVKSTASENHKLVKGDWLEINKFCLKCQFIKLDMKYIYIFLYISFIYIYKRERETETGYCKKKI